jgi:hypothetical protein
VNHAQNRLDARDELTRLEGLGQIVVGAELESDDAIGDVAASRQHDDRNAARRTHRATDSQTQHKRRFQPFTRRRL